MWSMAYNLVCTLMPSSQTDVLDLLLRVGCRLVYHNTLPVTLLLCLKPHTSPHQRVEAETMAFGDNPRIDSFADGYGNFVYRLFLQPGQHEIRHDALVAVSSLPENHDLIRGELVSPRDLPPALLRYTLPSRYCDSDKLADFAWQNFGMIENGLPRVRAISTWVHRNIEYRYGSGRPDLSAWDVLQRGYGVCRDFAHLLVALCRTFNLPARYVTGHLPDIAAIDATGHMDFHAYSEVYLSGAWHTFDARFNLPRTGRVKIAHGLDAVDSAFSMFYGAASLTHFQVWAYQIERGTVELRDPIDLSKRLDNRMELLRQLPRPVHNSVENVAGLTF